MGMMTLQEALGFIQARVPAARLVGEGGMPLSRVHTDTRTLQAGDLFVALKGERYDANAFLADARKAGAAAAVAHGGLLDAAGLPGIEVPDTLAALGALAAGWRAQFRLPLIGVTGSNGKTTVTQMLAAVLQAWKGPAAFATQGNFNNDIGVPLMLLRLNAAHEAAVIELGMNHPGEISYLAGLARPTVALVNNAQREHLEFMHTVQAVAEENGACLPALPADGVAVFPAGDAYTALWRQLAAGRRCVTFGADGADVRCTAARWEANTWHIRIETPQGGFDTTLRIAGMHNVTNALAATACAWAAGVPLDAVARGLSAFVPVRGARAPSACRRTGAWSRRWTTPTTPTPIPCAPPSTCWPACPVHGCWCWATWARWASKGRSSTPKRARRRAPAASTGCSRWARSAPTLRRPTGRMRGISKTWHRCLQRCGKPCPRWAACW